MSCCLQGSPNLGGCSFELSEKDSLSSQRAGTGLSAELPELVSNGWVTSFGN